VWWAATEADMPPTTRASYHSQLTQRLLPYFGKRLLTEIEPEDIVAFREKWKSSPSSANMSMAVITRLYRFAIERGWVKSIPTSQLMRLPEHPHSQALTEAQVRTLYDAFKASDHPARFTLMLIVITGCRRDEAEGITVSEIVQHGRDRWIWKLPASRTKQDERHEIPLIGQDEYDIAQGAAEWGAKVSTRRSQVGRLLDQERKCLGLPQCGPHALRHRFITEALAAGESVAVLSQRTGQTVTTLMGYADKMTDAVMELAERQQKRRGFT